MDNLFKFLYLFIPLSFFFNFQTGPCTFVFVFAALGIIPLAKLMSDSTEIIAEHVGEVFGGLINATFGNACELIISIIALQKGYFDVVKASLTGSMLSNILLVLGASMFAGGISRQHQKFNKISAMSQATSLAVASISLIIPTLFHYIYTNNPAKIHILHESRLALFISTILFACYLAGLFFSLKTHKNLFTSEHENANESKPNSNLKFEVFKLLLASVLVAFMSEMLVSSIAPITNALNLSQTFIGVIIIAIIGNAAEHSTAVICAMKNKMDLSINIALGSSTQIALFVAPIIVFTSFIIGKPMNLCFSYFEVLAIATSVIVLSFVASDGECNWLEGFQLMAIYLIFASSFYFL